MAKIDPNIINEDGKKFMKTTIEFKLISKGYRFTKRSIKKFQKDNNLNPTGIIDAPTYAAINNNK